MGDRTAGSSGNPRQLDAGQSPAEGATDVDPVTEVRIRFDRPMNPAEFFLEWNAARNDVLPEPGFRMRAEAYYDPDKYEFTFPVTLTSGSMHRLQLPEEHLFGSSSLFRSFRSLEGSAAATHRWEFQTRGATADAAKLASQVTAIEPPATSRVSAFTRV